MLKLGFEFEDSINESGVGTYWCRLQLYYKGKYITYSGGKGNTPEFARASAYAEIIERLQSDSMKINREYYTYYNKEDFGKYEFINFPDEKKEYDKDKYLKELKDDFVTRSKGKVYETVIGKFVEQHVNSLYNSYGYIPLDKYTSSITGENVYVDALLMRGQLEGSNGLCAGNTKHEALLQGLSEIVERYSKYLIYKNNMCLPIIPDEYLTEYSKNVCGKLEHTGRYLVEVRDASLGIGLPVVAVILYDKLRRGYVVSFGSFPVFEIALDRTINELLQYQDVNNVGTISQFISYEPSNYEYSHSKKLNGEHVDVKEYFDNKKLHASNFNNKAIFKDKMLSNQFDYEFKPWSINKLKSNEELFEDLCLLISKQFNTDILYKDCSFLGFHSYSVLCPNMIKDQFFGINGIFTSLIQDRGCVEEFIYGGFKDKDKFIKEYENMYKQTTLRLLLGKPLKYKGHEIVFMDGYIEFIKGNYEEASRQFMQRDIDLTGRDQNETFRKLDLYGCLENYIGLKASIGDETEILNILNKIYSQDIVNIIANACKDYKTLGEALFVDRSNELCLVDWTRYHNNIEIANILDQKKKEYYKD